MNGIAGASVLDRRRQPQVAPVAELVPELERHAMLALDQLGPALALVLDVPADLGAQRFEICGRGRGHVVT